jgi:hypothetical protein
MNKSYCCLTYAGAIPFIICAVGLLLGIQELPWLGSMEKILSVYGLVIVTFLAGSHWGQHLHIQGVWGRVLPLLSNIIAVGLWLAFLVFSFKALLASLGAGLVILLIIDNRLFQDNLITRHYWQTRCLVTAVVIATLIISAMAA